GHLFGASGFLAQDRAVRQDAALAMWRAQPLLGVGFDHYPRHFVACAGDDPRIAHLAGTPDNTYLTLLAENGLIGLAAFLALTGSALARGLRGAARAADPLPLRSATAALAALLVNLFGYSALYWSSPCMLLGWSCGLVGGLASAATAAPTSADRPQRNGPQPGGGSSAARLDARPGEP